jgi:UDP-2,3-diacylglucosamine pyrophosphatase LpxH
MPERAQFRNVFISDAHVGAGGARTADLARFLNASTPVAYYNCGDWVESCSALVEYDDGRLEDRRPCTHQ